MAPARPPGTLTRDELLAALAERGVSLTPRRLRWLTTVGIAPAPSGRKFAAYPALAVRHILRAERLRSRGLRTAQILGLIHLSICSHCGQAIPWGDDDTR